MCWAVVAVTVEICIRWIVRAWPEDIFSMVVAATPVFQIFVLRSHIPTPVFKDLEDPEKWDALGSEYIRLGIIGLAMIGQNMLLRRWT